MHGLLLTVALTSAIVLRLVWRSNSSATWNQRWIATMFSFLLPPLLLLTSAVALVCMGPHGMGISHWEGFGTYALAIGFLSVAVGLGGVLWVQAWRSIDRLRQYPLQVWETLGLRARLLPLDLPFIAQVGLWNPEIVLSRGMLEQLDGAHLRAVIAHEQAHAIYHDTFWFFCFGWLRRLTVWLPQTEGLWQELLLLRELRADRVAAQQTDSLLLAEALVVLVRSPMVAQDWMATVHPAGLGDRFEERIEAILGSEPLVPIPGWQVGAIVFAGLVPLLMVPFHY